jgi:hypothetical protein
MRNNGILFSGGILLKILRGGRVNEKQNINDPGKNFQTSVFYPKTGLSTTQIKIP